MKYVIIGGGPTGLSLAYALSNSDHEIILIEKNTQLGGSWNSRWVDNKYWSENNPKVLAYSGYTKKFLNEIGVSNKNLGQVYGGLLQANSKMLSFIYNNINKYDILKLLNIFTVYNIKKSNKTVQDVIEDYTLDKSTANTLEILSILLSDRPDKTNINDFIMSLRPAILYQYKDINMWHARLEYILKARGVQISKGVSAKELVVNNNKISKVLTTNNIVIDCDRVFLCCQSYGMLNVLANSHDIVKNNWIQWHMMKKWCESTYYIGFGFQIHFYDDIKSPTQWCWSCKSDWVIIILPVSNWLTTYTKYSDVKAVWSCCIVDMDTKSNFLKLTANECSTKDQVIGECMRQIKTHTDIGYNYQITTSKNLRLDLNHKWLSENTGFSRGKYDNLPMKGRIDNLFALGCFTEKNNSHISTKETAILSTVKYLNKYESDVISFHNRPNILCDFINILIILILVIIVAQRINRVVIPAYIKN